MVSQRRIERLARQWKELAASEENQRRLEMWGEPVEFRHYWRGVPRPGCIPVVGELATSSWRRLLGFSCTEFYTIPLVHLVHKLQMLNSTFCLLEDDTPLREVSYWLGTASEQAFFGLQPEYYENLDPWNNPVALLPDKVSEEHIARLRCLGFKDNTGIMRLAKEFFSSFREHLDPKYVPNFLSWGRGPFGVAFHLRGATNLLVDTVLNPRLVHQLMDRITEERIRWFNERRDFNPESDWVPSILNDEVNCPFLSPTAFREFVVPYEQKLATFHGGVYYHSCGDLTGLLTGIAEIRPIKLFNVSPLTSLEETTNVLGVKVPLEITVDCVRDILEADEETMRAAIVNRVELCIRKGVEQFYLRTESFYPHTSLQKDLVKLRQWISIAKDVVRANTHG